MASDSPVIRKPVIDGAPQQPHGNTMPPAGRPSAAASRKCPTAPPNEKLPFVTAVTANVSVVRPRSEARGTRGP